MMQDALCQIHDELREHISEETQLLTCLAVPLKV